MAIERANQTNIPFVDGKHVLIGGVLHEWKGEFKHIYSPIVEESNQEKILIGKLPEMDEATAIQALEYARAAWGSGRGEWPQMSAQNRIEVIRNLVERLKELRGCLIDVLMWEICKSRKDAATEFDRTMDFIEKAIHEYQNLMQQEFSLQTHGETFGKVLRCPIGVMLALGPSNYPFNETYTSLIPALLVGNVVILKVPSTGGLVHFLTQEIFQQIFPKGVVNFIYGSGRTVASPIMQQGVEILAFVGTSKAVDALISLHPAPHRLMVNLSLEGKNLAIVTNNANIEDAAKQIAAGAITYNGQRCTALKLIFAQSAIAHPLLHLLNEEVKKIGVGLPWDEEVKITPINPEQKEYLSELITDAKAKGAVSISGTGDFKIGSLMEPVILFPTSSQMRLWREEQFGPVLPVCAFDDLEEVYTYVSDSSSGLQCSLFSDNHEEVDRITRVMVNSVGRVNINIQSGRSPDEFPFTGRKSSANGVLSSSQSITSFSLPVVIASKEKHFEKERLDRMLQEML